MHSQAATDSRTGMNYIGGRWVAPEDGALFEQRNPADMQVTGRWPSSSPVDVERAISAASGARADWARRTVFERAKILSDVLDLITARADTLEAVIVTENGKTTREARSEVDSTVREMEYQLGEGVRQFGVETPASLRGVFTLSRRVPLGVVAAITPWNFPLNVATRKVTPALVAGNTVVMKASSLTPGVADTLLRCFADADLPAGVLNLVHGDGSVVGDAIVRDRRIAAISFTGSTPVGMGIHARAAETLARTQLEMGGKNPLVVLRDADIGQAAEAAVVAGYACAGQWCTSTSRVIVERSLFAEFAEVVRSKVAGIVTGRGDDPRTTMGPVCGTAQLENVLRWVDRGRAEGATVLAGGHRITADGLERGCFVAPTVFTGVSPDMTIAREEIFGPVLCLMEARDFDDALEIANAVDFGLSSSVFTRDLERAMAFVERSEVGLTHVNLHTAYKEPQTSFGGVKLSGAGIPEAGSTGVEFFTRHKVAYVRHG